MVLVTPAHRFQQQLALTFHLLMLWGYSEPAHHPLDACYYSIVDEPQLS
jgi:hypothetical protein